MTVQELLDQLATMPRGAVIVMSHDGESDHISPVASINLSNYQDEPGEWFNSDLTCRGWLNNAPDRGSVPAVCFWPDHKGEAA